MVHKAIIVRDSERIFIARGVQQIKCPNEYSSYRESKCILLKQSFQRVYVDLFL